MGLKDYICHKRQLLNLDTTILVSFPSGATVDAIANNRANYQLHKYDFNFLQSSIVHSHNSFVNDEGLFLKCTLKPHLMM